MSDLSSRLASAVEKAKRLNRAVDTACNRLEDVDDRDARNYARQLATAKSNLDMDILPTDLKDIALKVVALQQVNNDQKSQLRSLQAQLDRTKEENKALRAENKQLKKDIDEQYDSTFDLRQAKRQIDQLKREKKELKQQLEDADSDGTKLVELKANIKTLQTEKAALKQDKTNLKALNSTLQKETRDLEREKVVLKDKVDDLQDKYDRFGPRPCKEPKCGGCRKRIYHWCTDYGNGKFVRFDPK